MEAVIHEVASGDTQPVHDLYAEVFGEGPLAAWKRRWTWQFRDTPAASDNPARFWVAELDDAVVGFVASFPAKFRVVDRVRVIQHPCDLMVSKRARGHRLGERLIKAYVQSNDIILPNALVYSPGAARIYDRLGYAQLPIEPISLRPYRAARMLGAFIGPGDGRGRTVLRGLARLAGPVAEPILAVARALSRPVGSQSISVELIGAPGTEFDVVWQQLERDFDMLTVRDRAWVAWRYFDDPTTRHTVFLARDGRGTPVGYTAVSEAALKGLTVGRIMDIFASPSRPDVASALLGAAIEELEGRDVDVVSCLGLHPSLRSLAQRSLFLTPQRLELPARLLWQGEPDLQSRVLDPAGWHLSYADGDEAFG